MTSPDKQAVSGIAGIPSAAIEAHTVALARQIASTVMKSRGLSRDNGKQYTIALDAALAAITETTNAARTLALAWRDDNKAEVADGDTSPAAHQIRGAGIEMNAFAGALKRGDHLKVGQ